MFDWTPYQDIYANLVASGLTTLASRVVDADRRRSSASKSLPDDALADMPARVLVSQADVPDLRPEVGGERLRRFLLSAEAREMVAALGLAALFDSDSLRASLQARFLFTMSWYLSAPEASVRTDGERLFSSLSVQVARAVAPARARLEHGGGDAEELPLFAHVQTTTRRVTDIFTESRVPEYEATTRFEAQYRSAVQVRFGRLEPPNHEGGTIPIEALYVAPTFIHPSDQERRPIGTEQVLANVDRTVILGKPGAGKSSFARSFAHRLAAADADGPLVPFVVELRDYAVQRRVNGFGVVEYIEHVAKSRYQAPAPPHAIEYLLNSGRGVLVFDGLDELLDLTDRRDVRSDVDTIARLYPATPILVTSRERGYREAPLDDRMFAVLHIADFSDDQVAEYVQKWFRLERNGSRADQDERIAGFLEESTTVADLRRSPLLLALMCGLYRRRGYIPRNRAAVYEECADMLFDRWDRSRKIDTGRPLEAHLRPALQHIAHWIFSDVVLQAGVTHSALVAHMRDYILREVIDDPDVALRAAEDFVSFCHGRGWVLVGVGTSEDDEELYGFAHQTFLEYFTASWIASNASSSVAMANELCAKVAYGEWEIVALLAFQLRSHALRPAGNEMFEALLVAGDRLGLDPVQPHAYLLQFGVRVLDFFAPRPDLLRRFAAAVTRNYLTVVGDLWVRKALSGLERYDVAESTARELLQYDGDARPLVLSTVSEILEQTIETNALGAGPTAADLAIRGDDHALRATPVVPTAMIERRVEAWARDDDRLAAWALEYGLVPIDRVLAASGVRWVFAPLPSPGSPAVFMRDRAATLIDVALNGLVEHPDAAVRSPAQFFAELEALRDAFVLTPTPWFGAADFTDGPEPFDVDHVLNPRLAVERQPIPLEDWPSAVRLAVLLLFAAGLELSSMPARRRIPERLAERDDEVARFLTTLTTFGVESATAYGLTGEDAAYFDALAANNVRLVRAS